MKFVQNSDEYIKKDEFKSAYNYQQKAIDDKISEMKTYIDKMQEIISLRFGGDLGKNKYDAELENLNTRINEIKNDVSNHEQNLHNELDKAIENKFVRINDLNIKTEEMNKKIQGVEQNIEEAKKAMESNTKGFEEEVERLKKEGKNKLTIVMQGKKIDKLEEDAKKSNESINSKIEGVNSGLIQKINETNNNTNNLKGILESNKNDQNKKYNEIEQQIAQLKKENEELRKRNEMFDTEIQKVMIIAINLEKKINSNLAKEIDKIVEQKTRTIYNKYEKQLRDRIKLIEKRMKAQVKGEKSIKLLPEPNYIEDNYRYTPIDDEEDYENEWTIQREENQQLGYAAKSNKKLYGKAPVYEDDQLLFKPKKNQILGWFKNQ